MMNDSSARSSHDGPVPEGLASRCAIAVMAKQSTPGRTKTRLIPHVGADGAAALNTAFLKDVAANLVAAGEMAPIDPFMAFAPAGSEAFFRGILPRCVGLVETAKPDFGDCLFHGLETLLGRGYGSVCLLNSDSPTLPPGYLVAAAVALAVEGDRVVIGPAIDGGYYLIGLKAAHRPLFTGIAWSTERVFEQTVRRAAEIGLPVVVLPDWYDVDELPMLELLASEVLTGRRFREAGGRIGGQYARGALLEIARQTELQLPGLTPPRAEVA